MEAAIGENASKSSKKAPKDFGTPFSELHAIATSPMAPLWAIHSPATLGSCSLSRGLAVSLPLYRDTALRETRPSLLRKQHRTVRLRSFSTSDEH